MRRAALLALPLALLAPLHAHAAIILFDNSAREFVWGGETSQGNFGTPYLDIFQPPSQHGTVKTAVTFNTFTYIPNNNNDYGYTELSGGSSSARVSRMGDRIFGHYFADGLAGFAVTVITPYQPGGVIGVNPNVFVESPVMDLALRESRDGPLVPRPLFPADAYVGVRIDRGSVVTYGWIHLIDRQPVAWAYESDNGVPITVPDVPAPAPGALLLTGAVLSVIRRRR